MGAYDKRELTIGVLAIQGGFQEHQIAILKCSKQDFLVNFQVKVIKVTEVCQLKGLDGIVLPGGESTTIRIILNDNLLEGLIEWAKDERHVTFGTCAGLILLSKNIENRVSVDIDRLAKLGMMDVTTSRNFFGRQLNSFEGFVAIKEKTMLDENMKKNKIMPGVCSGVFIRAPAVLSIDGPSVKTLATMMVKDKEVVVGVQDKNCIGLAFHPELTEDLQWHIYFLKQVIERKLNSYDCDY